MNPMKVEFFNVIATIKQGEVIEFDLVGKDHLWPEAYSTAGAWLDKNPCGIDMVKTPDSKKITISRGKTSPPPKNVPVYENVKVEVEVEPEVKVEPEKKFSWGLPSDKKDKEL